MTEKIKLLRITIDVYIKKKLIITIAKYLKYYILKL